MKRFMKVICVILLCLIISASVPAYAGSISTTAHAGSILWSTKHSSTSLEKDREWISEQLLSEQSVTAMEAIEDIDGDIEDPEDSEEFIEIIDATLVVEGTESTPLEITMDTSTTDEIERPEAGVNDGAENAKLEEDVDDPIEGENQNS